MLKLILYIAFILAHGFLLFKLPFLYPRKKLFQILGIGLAASFILTIVISGIFVLVSIKNPHIAIYESQIINFFGGIISLFFFSLGIHFFLEVMFDKVLIGFHKKHNTDNLHKNPLKFVLNNSSKIKNGYKIVFFLGGFLIYYGVVYGSS